jgi:hypothetical protein
MIDIGFELGTGRPIKIPDDRHMVIVGQTQLSGKTTTLEAIAERTKKNAVAFITRRGEASFEYGHRIQPYFHAPLDPQTRDIDWQFVESLLGITLEEQRKSDPQRLAIIEATVGAKTIQKVHDNVVGLMTKARGRAKGTYVLLDAYFRKVIPELERAEYSDKLDLHRGLNVMDISDFSENLRGLFVRSVTEKIYSSLRNTNTIVPEAHSMIPEGRNSPSKIAIRELIRQGAASGNFVHIDSQDFAGIDKACLRQVGVWIIGVQREQNELDRVLKSFVAVPARPSVDEVMQLGKGEFFISWGEDRAKCYVWPLWADGWAAQQYAKGAAKIPVMPARPRKSAAAAAPVPDKSTYKVPEGPMVREVQVTTHEYRLLQEELEKERSSNVELRKQIAALRTTVNGRALLADFENDNSGRRATPASPLKIKSADQFLKDSATSEIPSLDALLAEFKKRAIEDPAILQLLRDQPEIRVNVKRRILEMNDTSTAGRIALLITEKFFDSPQNSGDVTVEFKRRGWFERKTSNAAVLKPLAQIAEMGFLTREGNSYQVVPGMKVNVVEAA